MYTELPELADVHTPQTQDKCDSQHLQQYPLSTARSSYRVQTCDRRPRWWHRSIFNRLRPMDSMAWPVGPHFGR